MSLSHLLNASPQHFFALSSRAFQMTWRDIPKELRSRDQTTRRTIVWRNMFGRFCSEWTCGRSCFKHWANWPKKQTMLQDRKKTSFFRRRLLIRTNSMCILFWRHEPMEKWDAINIWTNKPYMEFNTLAAFRASSTKCHVNIAQGRNHGRNLVSSSMVVGCLRSLLDPTPRSN